MAEFKDISEFNLKPVLDGNEEIQISAENKTTLMRIASLVLSNLFTLDGFTSSDTGFGPIIAQDTLVKAIQKVNQGFAGGQARLVYEPDEDIVILAMPRGLMGFDPLSHHLCFYEGSVDISWSNTELFKLLEEGGDYLSWDSFVKEILVDGLPSSIYGGQVVWVGAYTPTTSRSITIAPDTFIRGESSAIVGGMTEKIAPTITLRDTGWTLLLSSTWDSTWSTAGIKVITFQRFSPSTKIMVANVGLYNQA